MAKYVVQMVVSNSGEVLDDCVDDEVFDSYEDAEEFASDCASSFAQGAEDLENMGRSFTDPNERDFIVVER